MRNSLKYFGVIRLNSLFVIKLLLSHVDTWFITFWCSFALVCPPGLGKLIRFFSRVNGDAVDFNQKCYGVRIYSRAELVILCAFM